MEIVLQSAFFLGNTQSKKHGRKLKKEKVRNEKKVTKEAFTASLTKKTLNELKYLLRRFSSFF